MRERDIMHETGPFWVGREPKAYTVFRNGATHATPDSSYARTADGLSIAIARCDYLARRAAQLGQVVTVTDAERVIWSGSYAEFARANVNALSVSEHCELERTGTLTIGGGAAPALQVTLERSPQLDAPTQPGPAKSERPEPAPNMRRDMQKHRATAR